MRRVQESDVVLAIIGPHWAAAAEDRARRSVLDRSGRGRGAAGDRNRLHARARSSSRCSSTTPRCRPERRCRDRSGRSPTSRRRRCATPRGNATSMPSRRSSPTSPRGPGRGTAAVAGQPARLAGAPHRRRAGRVLHRRALGRDGSRLGGQRGRPREALAARRRVAARHRGAGAPPRAAVPDRVRDRRPRPGLASMCR